MSVPERTRANIGNVFHTWMRYYEKSAVRIKPIDGTDGSERMMETGYKKSLRISPEADFLF